MAGTQVARDPAHEVKWGWNQLHFEDQNGWGSGGIFFSTDRATAEGYRYSFQNGLQIVSVLTSEFLEMGRREVLVKDRLEREAYRVPVPQIPAFNFYVVRNAAFNSYPEDDHYA